MEKLHGEPPTPVTIHENKRTNILLEGQRHGDAFVSHLASRWHLLGTSGLEEAIQAGNGTLNTAFLIHGFGCAGVCDDEGRIQSTYFDGVVRNLATIDPTFTTAFSYDAPGYNLTPQEDKASIKNLEWYGIRHQPFALMRMLKRWAQDIREANTNGLSEINVALVGHSMGGRALAELYGMRYQYDDGTEGPLMEYYLDKLSQVAGVKKINAVPIFVAPALELHPKAKKLFDALRPLRHTDSYVKGFMKSFPGSADSVNSLYRWMTGKPYEQISEGILSGKHRFSLVDNAGFLKGFSRNNPHVLLHQATQLERPSRTIPTNLGYTLQERTIPYMVITNGDDRIISNQAVNQVFGDPTGSFEPEDMDSLFHSAYLRNIVQLEGVGHTEMLHVPHTISQLIVHRMVTI